ncbi:MAG TPA: flagellar hook-associated protein FlgL [Pirellulaceae bacterium]|jgi:flagellar hook-associated protein 3 FlgL
MSGFFPVPSTRSTNLLMQTRLIQQLDNNQVDLQKLQTQISTGQRISLPGEDPAAASRAETIQSLLELKAQAQTNSQVAQSYLDATDTALSNVSTLITNVRSAALAAASDTASDASRQAAAQQVDQAITQLLNTANQNFRGRYLFAGSESSAAPFTQTADGIVYSGNDGSINSYVDIGLAFGTNAPGSDVFGAYSANVQGSVDLNPSLTNDTPVSALNGGQGLSLGSIEISDGTSKKVIDLSSANSVGDIIRLIDSNPPAGRTLTTTINGSGLTISIDAAGAGNLTIKDLPGGTTAKQLQVATPALGVGVNPVVGGDLNPSLRLTTRLSDLQTAAPLDLASGLQIQNGGKTYTIDTSSAQTVEDLLNSINSSGANVLAQIDPSGTSLVVRSTLSGSDFSVGENGGTLATQLGIRSLDTTTALADLNHGNGVSGTTGTDFTIHRKDGTDLAIDISSATTIGDVLNLINNDPNNQNPFSHVAAYLNPTGNGIQLYDDGSAGTDTLSVTDAFGSNAAVDLGLIPPGQTTASATSSAFGDTLTGTDTNPQEVSGLFNSLLRLKASLENFNRDDLSRATALLDKDFDRVTFARADVGARNQAIDTIQSQLTDQVTQLKSNLSDDIDTNLPDAISQLTARQAALQASLQLAAQVFQTSLLNYL